MGSKMIKLGVNGAKFGARLRPFIVQGMAEMRTWRLPALPNKNPPSKKPLLLYNPSCKETDPKEGVPMETVVGNTSGLKVAPEAEKTRDNGRNDTITNKLNADEDDEEGRKISAFPGSPSFRIFFNGEASRNTHKQIGKIEGAKQSVSTSDPSPSKERCVLKKVKDVKKRYVRRVQSGKKAGLGVKNRIKAKACYHTSTLTP